MATISNIGLKRIIIGAAGSFAEMTKTISSITGTDDITVVTTTAHGLAVGDSFSLSGVTGVTELNAVWEVDVVLSSTSLKFTAVGVDALGASGGIVHKPGSNMLSAGIRQPSKLLITEFNQIKDFKDRAWKNMLNVQILAESVQMSARDLSFLAIYCNSYPDIQIAAVEQVTNQIASGGIFNFTGADSLGVDFEYEINEKNRLMKITLEGAKQYSDMQTYLNSVDTATSLLPVLSPMSFFDNESGDMKAAVFPAWLLGIKQGASLTDVFDKRELTSRKLNIKSISEKNIDNESLVTGVKVSVELVGRNASIAKIKEALAYDQGAQLVWEEGKEAGTSEKFTFLPNQLTPTREFELGDKNRTTKIVYEGNLTLAELSAAITYN